MCVCSFGSLLHFETCFFHQTTRIRTQNGKYFRKNHSISPLTFTYAHRAQTSRRVKLRLERYNRADGSDRPVEFNRPGGGGHCFTAGAAGATQEPPRGRSTPTTCAAARAAIFGRACDSTGSYCYSGPAHRAPSRRHFRLADAADLSFSFDSRRPFASERVEAPCRAALRKALAPALAGCRARPSVRRCVRARMPGARMNGPGRRRVAPRAALATGLRMPWWGRLTHSDGCRSEHIKITIYRLHTHTHSKSTQKSMPKSASTLMTRARRASAEQITLAVALPAQRRRPRAVHALS